MSDFWDKVREVGKSTGETVKDLSRSVESTASQAGRSAAALYRRTFGEDVTTILRDCPVVTDILNRRNDFEKDPAVFGRLYNVRVRPLVTAAVLAAGGAGTEAFDEAIARVTRHIFDGDQLVGGSVGDRIAAFVGPEKVESINRFMDTVPGSDVMGGGWLHRVQHGHDVAGLVNVYHEYGFDGLVQGMYHVFGRDSFTPAGIPVLPSGSQQVHEFLTNDFGLGSLEAADLITLNVEELVARLALTVATKIVWDRFINHKERAELHDIAGRASEAATRRDFVTASALYKRALAINPHSGAMSFALGLARYATGDRFDAFVRFSNATSSLAKEEPTIELGGAVLSLRGVAAGMALASIDAPARTDRHWTGLLQEQAMVGLTAFQAVAEDLVDRTLRPAAHLSAALNYYLAGRLVGGAMYLSEREEILERISKKLDDCLAAVEPKEESEDPIGFLRRFARAELMPLPA